MSLSTSLEANKAFIIKSEITNRPYITTDRRGFIFYSEAEAYDFSKKTEGSFVEKGQYYNSDELLSYMFANGVQSVSFVSGCAEETVLLEKKRVTKGFYNSQLNASLCLLKCLQDNEYLEKMAASHFIVPARIRTEPRKEILYATLRTSGEDFYFLAFTDMSEYDLWAKDVSGWFPLLVNFNVMCQISKDRGYVINPYGNQLFLPVSVMSKYEKYSTAKDPVL